MTVEDRGDRALDEVQPELDVLAEGAFEHRGGVADHPVDLERLRVDDVAAGEGEQLPGERRGPLGRGADLTDVADGHRILDLPAEQRRVVEDHAEQVVEVVGDPAGQLAQALEAVGPLALLVEGLAPRLGLGLDAVAGVADRGEDELPALPVLDRAQADVRLEHRPVLAARHEVETGAEGSRLGIGRDLRPAPLVVVEPAGRREVLGPHADQLARSVAEQLLRLRVGEDDLPAVQHDQGVRALGEHLAEDLVGRAHGTLSSRFGHLGSGRG